MCLSLGMRDEFGNAVCIPYRMKLNAELNFAKIVFSRIFMDQIIRD